MPDWIAYGTLPYYPHMGSDDAEIWRRFILQNRVAYKSVAYDVGLGEGAPFNTVVNVATGGNLDKLYRYRVDVMGLTDSGIDIIEVKKRAGPRALEQVAGYRKLAQKYLKDPGVLNAVVVTDSLMPDMEALAKEYVVRLVVVE